MATVLDNIRDHLAKHFLDCDLLICERWDGNGRHHFEISGVLVGTGDAAVSTGERLQRAIDGYNAVADTLNGWGAKIPHGQGWSLNIAQDAYGEIEAYATFHFHTTVSR